MRFFLVDAFTEVAFRGNTAAVVLLDGPADPAWMQSVAAEFKHPETAFVELGGREVPLRWFTPTTEVELCGHATLAAGHVLKGEQEFDTLSGTLTTKADNGWVYMDFPADPPEETGEEVPLDVAAEYVGRGVSDLLVQVSDAAQVRALRPDFTALAELDARAIIVTAPGDRPGIDFVSRVFGPSVGIDEDPVTGSAHCTLTSYWAPKLGKKRMVAEQASERGGIVRVSLTEDEYRLRLAGQAVTIASGELHV